jgi:hypothetical protein
MKDHERRIRYWRPGVLTALLAVAAALLLDSGAQAGLKFPPAQTLSSGQNASGATVAVDSQDRATVAWWRLDGANQMIESVRLGADGVPGEVNILLSNAGDRFIGPQVAVDPQGSATVVWERDTDVFGDSGCSAGSFPTCVQAIRVDAEGRPGSVQTLSSFDTPERDPDLGGPGDGPRVAVDSQGRATVVWRRTEYTASGVQSRVQSARLGADGAAGEVQTLSGDGAGDPKLAMDSLGRATVVWPRFDGTKTRIESVSLGADGTPGEVKALSKRGQSADFPQVAVDPRGRATVVWRRTDRGKRRIQSLNVGADGSPGAVKTLAKSGDLRPQVAVDPRGRATVVWRRIKQTKRALVIRVKSVRLGAGGNPRAIKTLSKSRASTPQVAVDRRGRATVVWDRLRLHGKRGISVIEARRLGADGIPQAVQSLSKGEGVGSPQVAVDSKGRPTIVWAQSDLSIGGLIQSTRGRDRR